MVKLYVSLLENQEYSFFAMCDNCDFIWEYMKNHKDELIWDAPIGNAGQWMLYGSNPGKHPSDMEAFLNALFPYNRDKGLYFKYPGEDDYQEIGIGSIPISKILNRDIDARTEIQSIRQLLGI